MSYVHTNFIAHIVVEMDPWLCPILALGLMSCSFYSALNASGIPHMFLSCTSMLHARHRSPRWWLDEGVHSQLCAPYLSILYAFFLATLFWLVPYGALLLNVKFIPKKFHYVSIYINVCVCLCCVLCVYISGKKQTEFRLKIDHTTGLKPHISSLQ